MKKFQLFVILALLGCVAGLVYDIVNIESRRAQWEEHVQSAESWARLNEQVMYSQMYSRDCLEAVRMLANENGILCAREVKMTAYVTAMEEENTKLKNSLKESVENLERQIAEINQLHEELSRAHYRLEVLEAALKLVPTPAEEPTLDDIKDDILGIFDVIQGVDTAVTILNVLL